MITRRSILVTVLLFLLTAVSLAARGQSEDPIERARVLINRNRINEAILLLEQTVREDPDRIRQAEKLMDVIREIRGEYNVLFELLIDNLVNNPDNIERTLEIIDLMEELDEFPNERVARQVEDARIIAQLAFDRSLFEQEMTRALRATQEGAYTEAIAIYAALRALQRDDFEQRGYSEIFQQSVDANVETISAARERFVEVFPQALARLEALSASAERDVRTVNEEGYRQFREQLRELSQLAGEIGLSGQQVAVLRSQVPLQFPDRPIDWYLLLQDSVTRGRVNQRGEDGLQYALSQAYYALIDPYLSAAREQALSFFDRAVTATNADRLDVAQPLYSQSAEVGSVWRELAAMRVDLFGELPALSDALDTVPEEAGRELIEATGVVIAAEGLSGYSRLVGQVQTVSRERLEETLFSLESQVAVARGLSTTVAEATRRERSALEPLTVIGSPRVTEEIASRVERARSFWSDGLMRARFTERDLAIDVSQFRTSGIDTRRRAYPEQLDRYTTFLDGVERGTGGDAALIRVVRLPDEALEGYEAILQTVIGDIARIETALAELRGRSDYVVEDRLTQQEIARLELLLRRVTILRDRAREGVARAEDTIARSQVLEQEGRERIADARAAIASEVLDAASNAFEAAREAFFEALQLRDSATLRGETDGIIQEVGDQLQALRNLIVVREVRLLITQAENFYTGDNFVAARDTLRAAEQRWALTNIEENPEIQRLNQLVIAALSLDEGRELSVLDPLYPVLGNYLSVARQDIDEGERLWEEEERERAGELFERAIENLRNVRDVRPLNWDARILELRIEQIRNPAGFTDIFASRYNQALQQLEVVGPLPVYTELGVLSEINPNYPGLQNQIRRLEIMLNLREDPIDQTRANEAAALYRRAQGLSEGSLDQATVAVSLLEEAVELNPRDGEAKFLLDQLRIRLGGRATVALANADEQQYRRAETLFSQGQVLQAFQITERLLSVGNNANYPPLVELRRRIELRLGIN